MAQDSHPTFEGEYPVRFEVQYPEQTASWQVLIWKGFTCIPHMLVLSFLSIGASFAVMGAWLSILFTGRFPRGLHAYLTGVVRWWMRVLAYFLSLTDVYPPFSLSADAGPARPQVRILSFVVGCLLGGAALVVALPTALFIAIDTGIFADGDTARVTVRYDELTAGRAVPFETGDDALPDVWGTLIEAEDPADTPIPQQLPWLDRRFVAFRLEILRISDSVTTVKPSEFRLKDSDGVWHEPTLAFVEEEGTAWVTNVLFDVQSPARPDELQYRPSFSEDRVVYQFE